MSAVLLSSTTNTFLSCTQKDLINRSCVAFLFCSKSLESPPVCGFCLSLCVEKKLTKRMWSSKFCLTSVCLLNFLPSRRMLSVLLKRALHARMCGVSVSLSHKSKSQRQRRMLSSNYRSTNVCLLKLSASSMDAFSSAQNPSPTLLCVVFLPLSVSKVKIWKAEADVVGFKISISQGPCNVCSKQLSLPVCVVFLSLSFCFKSQKL